MIADKVRLLVAALDNERALAISAGDIRMKNFNFFVVLTGASLAAVWADKVPAAVTWWVATVGLVSSLVFLGLDIRGYQILLRSMKHMELLEDKVWRLAGLPTRIARPEVPTAAPAKIKLGKRILGAVVTHRVLYRTSFCIATVGWSFVLGFHLRGRLFH